MNNYFIKNSDNHTKLRKRNNSKFGLSLVALVMAIVIIIILAAISFVAYNQIVGKAQFAKFTHEISEIEQKVSDKQAENQKQSLTSKEKNLNKGFRKVYLNNAPDGFKSFDEGDVTGYWVDLDYINEHEIVLGHQSIDNIVATFGKDDVFVYDADGSVYYLKGYLNEDDSFYHRYSVKANMQLLKQPIISNISYRLAEDDTVAIVTVSVSPAYGNSVSVRVGDTIAEPSGPNTYVARIYDNDSYWALAKEENGYYSCSPINIMGIIKPLDKTPPIIDRMDIDYKSGGGTITISAHDYESKIIAYSFVKQGEPDAWETHNSRTFTSKFTITEPGTYVFKAKNEVYLVGESVRNTSVYNDYTITYNNNGGFGGPTTQIKNDYQAMQISNSIPTRPNYVFLGWAESSTATEPDYTAGGYYTKNGDATLYAVWQLSSYIITFNSNGGSPFNITQQKFYKTNLVLTTSAPDRTGFTFLGWSESSSATTAEYQKGGTFTKDANTTLYAVWQENIYTISYNANGGSGAPANQAKKHTETLTLSSITPTREGHDFLGWSSSPNSTNVDYTAGGSFTNNEDTTLYAVWEIKTYTITYNANGGSDAPANGTKTYDIAYPISNDVPTRNGHVFIGWDPSSSATSASYEAGQSYLTNEDITLYAVWDTIKYTITYNANGGSGAPSAQTKSYGETLTLSSTIPTNNGYIFKGWSSLSNSTVGEFQAGGSYTYNNDATLYAVWEELTATFSVGYTFNEDIKTLAGDNPENHFTENYSITSFRWANSMTDQNKANSIIVSTSPSNTPIYAWIDNGTVYLYSDAKTVYLNQHAEDMFERFVNVTYIDMSRFNSSRTINMSDMFRYCESLPSVDLTKLDTSNVTDMGCMFNGCKSFTNIDLTPLDTSKVKRFNDMFNSCYGLKSINLTDFNTESAITLNQMFALCTNLESIDVSSFDTRNVTDIHHMFYQCEKLETIDLSNFNTSNVTEMTGLFTNCYALKNVDITSFDIRKVASLMNLFYNCNSLEAVDLSHLDTSNVQVFNGMFQGCYALKKLDLSTFDTSSATSFHQMFCYCTSLEDLDISTFNTDKVHSMSGMFAHCQKLTNLDLTHFNTSNVTSFHQFFWDCTNLVSLDISTFNTSNVTSMYDCFKACRSLTELNVTSFDTSNVTDTRNMFESCTSLTELDIRNFDTSNVIYMSTMFRFNENLERIYASEKFVTTNVTDDGQSMFYGCYALDGGSNTLFNRYYTDKEYARLDGVNELPGYFYHVSTAQYLPGPQFKQLLFDNFGHTEESTPKNKTIRAIKWQYDGFKLSNIPENAINVGVTTGDNVPIHAWFEKDNGDTGTGVLKLFSIAPKISLNNNSQSMFSHLRALESLNLLHDLSITEPTSNVTNMSYMFDYCYSLRSLNLKNLDTSNVTTMSSMFRDCYHLSAIDLSRFNTAKVTDMSAMFRMCTCLETLDCSSFNTSNVSNMGSMFLFSGLKSLNISSFDTRNVTDMSSMFESMKDIEELDIRSFDTSNVRSMRYMFGINEKSISSTTGEKTRLKRILVSNTFVTNNVTSMRSLFNGLEHLESVEFIKNFDTSKVIDMNSMFACCKSLREIDVSSFDTSNVTDMGDMFMSCVSLNTLDLSNFVTSNVTNMERMFIHCTFEELNLDSFDTSKVNNMRAMFAHMSNIKELHLNGFDVSKVEKMGSMFARCSSLRVLETQTWNTNSLVNLSSGTGLWGGINDYISIGCFGLFEGCSSLESLDLSNWNFSGVDYMGVMFYNCSNLRTIDFGALDTSNVTKTTCMFMRASKLSKIYVSDNPDFSKATRSDGMFDDCRSLKGYLGTKYNANYVDKTRAHIDEGSSNPGYFSIRK